MSLSQSIWDGQINVKIVCEETEFLLWIPRNSYFPLYYADIANFFNSVISADLTSSPIWLEHEEVPLKWNIPAGVLYDLLYYPVAENRSEWGLSLRYDSPTLPYPATDIIPFSMLEDSIDYSSMLSQVVVNQLKQSTFVMNGNAKAMMSLSEDNSRFLWKAIALHDYSGFHSIVKKLHPRGQQPQRIPVKLYVAGTPALIQAPIAPLADGKITTLSDLLQKWVPLLFNKTTLLKAVPVIHGVDALVLADELLLRIWYAFRHLDNFLYVVVTFS